MRRGVGWKAIRALAVAGCFAACSDDGAGGGGTGGLASSGGATGGSHSRAGSGGKGGSAGGGTAGGSNAGGRVGTSGNGGLGGEAGLGEAGFAGGEIGDDGFGGADGEGGASPTAGSGGVGGTAGSNGGVGGGQSGGGGGPSSCPDVQPGQDAIEYKDLPAGEFECFACQDDGSPFYEPLVRTFEIVAPQRVRAWIEHTLEWGQSARFGLVGCNSPASCIGWASCGEVLDVEVGPGTYQFASCYDNVVFDLMDVDPDLPPHAQCATPLEILSYPDNAATHAEGAEGGTRYYLVSFDYPDDPQLRARLSVFIDSEVTSGSAFLSLATACNATPLATHDIPYLVVPETAFFDELALDQGSYILSVNVEAGVSYSLRLSLQWQ